MKVAGVITEYNPFHNGHKYQLEQIKRQTSADYIVVVMSGDFVQRGEPAIIDKYKRQALTRTERHGAAWHQRGPIGLLRRLVGASRPKAATAATPQPAAAAA